MRRALPAAAQRLWAAERRSSEGEVGRGVFRDRGSGATIQL